MAKENCGGGPDCIEVMKVAGIVRHKQDLIDYMNLTSEQVGGMVEGAVYYGPCPKCPHLQYLVAKHFIPHVYSRAVTTGEPAKWQALPEHKK